MERVRLVDPVVLEDLEDPADLVVQLDRERQNLEQLLLFVRWL
jgi:hypothetical protein